MYPWGKHNNYFDKTQINCGWKDHKFEVDCTEVFAIVSYVKQSYSKRTILCQT